MRKLAIFVAVAILLLVAMPVLAGAMNATYLQWTWGGPRSGYFMGTDSGIVQAWSYEHPIFEDGDVHWIFKPKARFPNAEAEGCDEGNLMQILNWPSDNFRTRMDTPEYVAAFNDIFGVENAEYVLCIYPMD